MKTLTLIAVTVVSVSGQSTCWAQYPAPVTYWCEPHHASTVYESALRGQAAWLVGYGQYCLAFAQAENEHERAESYKLQNLSARAQAKAEQQAVNRKSQAAQRGPRRTEQQLRRIAHQAAPRRLTSAELLADGRIDWPRLLRTKEMTAARREVQAYFTLTSRSEGGGPGTGALAKTLAAAEQLRVDLKRQIKDVPTAEYVAARRFLDSLRYEVRRSEIRVNQAPSWIAER